MTGGSETEPVAEAGRSAYAERPWAQPREEAAQELQVGFVHRAKHERAAAGGAALPFEVGEDPRSRRGKDSNLLVFPHQADLRGLNGDGRVWAYVEAVQG